MLVYIEALDIVVNTDEISTIEKMSDPEEYVALVEKRDYIPQEGITIILKNQRQIPVTDMSVKSAWELFTGQ